VSASLDTQSLEEALEEGRLLSTEQAFDLAVSLVEFGVSRFEPHRKGEKRARKGPLSRREYEVLELLAEGCSNKEIARRLIVSDSTVKFHVTSILNKLGVNGRTEAVSVAMKRRILPD
jgi:DNA-binding NarL/FixJ family response regulator